MRTLRVTSVAIATLLALSACGSGGQEAEEVALKFVNASREGSCKLYADKTPQEIAECQADAREANDTQAMEAADYAEAPEVVATEEWREDGYLVEITYKTEPEFPLMHWAYGLVQKDGQWKILRFNQIDPEMVGTENAACKTLATGPGQCD